MHKYWLYIGFCKNLVLHKCGKMGVSRKMDSFDTSFWCLRNWLNYHKIIFLVHKYFGSGNSKILPPKSHVATWQYMLFARNCDGLNLSSGSFMLLHENDYKVSLERELV